MRMNRAVRGLLIALGVVCSLTGAASGELYPARARAARGPSQRTARLPLRDADHVCEWDSARMEWVTASMAAPEFQIAAEPPALAVQEPAFASFEFVPFEPVAPPARRATHRRGRSPPLTA